MAKDPTKPIQREAERREKSIRTAIQTIRAIFYGGKGFTQYKGPIKPGMVYYAPTGERYVINSKYDEGGATVNPEAFRKALKEGNVYLPKTYAGQFNNKFYNNAKQAYQAFIRPQLEKKYGTAKEDLTYALSRQGMLDSTLRTERFGDLLEDYGTQSQTVNEQAQDVADSLRSNVLNAETQLIANAQSAADPALAASQAAASAQAASAVPAFDPLGNVFAEVTSGLATQAELERRKLAAYDVGVPNLVGSPSQTIVA